MTVVSASAGWSVELSARSSPASRVVFVLLSVSLEGALTTLTVQVSDRPFQVLIVIVAVPYFFAVSVPVLDTVTVFALLEEKEHGSSPSPPPIIVQSSASVMCSDRVMLL